MITETQTSNIAFSIGGAYTSGANSIVSNCNISYNYSQGFLKGSNISPVVGGFMHQNSSGGSKILNSVINNNLSNTLKISSFWCPGGMFLSYGNNFEVINCVISMLINYFIFHLQ